MLVGAVFPQLEIGHDPVAIRDWAQAVEAMGYAHILVYEHVLGFRDEPAPSVLGPLVPEVTIYEPFVLFGYLAGVTRRVGLTAGIVVLPQRQTVLVAKQAAVADVLSGGRLQLGVGVGRVINEYRALNENYRNRGKRIEEQIAVLRALWTQQVVTFHGRWHQLDAAGMSPLPVQRPIPMWIGGMSEPAMRRAAILSDGWLTALMAPDDAARQKIEEFRGYVEAAGRAPHAVGLDVHMALRSAPEGRWGEYAEAWRELGVTHISVDTQRAGFASPSEHIAALRRVGETLAL